MSITASSSSVPPAAAGRSSWWRVPAAEVAEAMGVDPAVGLDPAEVERRRSEVGPNALAEPPTRPAWKKFLDQFRSGIVYILNGAAVLAGLVGDLKDPIVIAVVLLVNAVLGYIQEARAESAMEALEQMLVARVKVRRGGTLQEVSTEDLVPGDVVMLEPGDRVPADGRLLVAVNASVDESALTGESIPVDKVVQPLSGRADAPDDLPLGERTNLAFMNTTVVRGRAELLVTATGMATEMGRVAELLGEGDPGPTPLERQLDSLGKRLAVIAIVAVSAVFVLQVAQGESFADAAIGAVALAVAAIPEGLPAVVTVTLAIGVSQMAKRNAIVKRLHSVETLGSTTVICSDKTGTLTLNRMTVREVVGDRTAGLLTGARCNDAALDPDGGYVGDPTEGAIVVAATESGIDVAADRVAHPRIGEVPFDSGAKFMATFHRDGDDVVVHVKGAPDVLLPRCTARRDDAGVGQAIDADAVQADNGTLASEGLRVLAVATRRLDPGEVLAADGTVAEPDRWLYGLTLDALVGILDPPRAEARDAIDLCRTAGIDVKMITGDHAATAAAIAGELHIRGRVVTGDDLERMTDDELAAEIDGIGVCARVSPEHKVRVVRALKANGHVVAMTGDGVNDAAALRNADIGVAMGITGTEVTKEAGDMVLADDNFATIVGAVERGRTIYDNIVKFVRFQLTTNLGAITTILAASIMGLPVPFTAVQVLWVNIIADGPPALTLGVDPPAPDVMGRSPRSQGEAILTPVTLAPMVFGAVVMAAGTLAIYVLAEREWGEPIALTMTFNTFVLFQMANVFNARVQRRSFLNRYTLTNGKVWIAVGIVVALQVLATKWAPMQAIFDTETLSLEQWLLCLGVAVSIIPLDELRKLVSRLVTRRPPAADAVPTSTPTTAEPGGRP
jgi:Ca2+-transporting ATPase